MKNFVYILKNQKGKYYIGITGIPLEDRLARHNRGDIKTTKFGRPWQLIYSESYNSYKSARAREKQIKSWHSGNAFKKLLARAAGSSKGRTADSGSVNPGSSPGPAAVTKRINKFGGVK